MLCHLPISQGFHCHDKSHSGCSWQWCSYLIPAERHPLMSYWNIQMLLYIGLWTICRFPFSLVEWRSKRSTMYWWWIGYTAVQIPFWVVTRSISFALSRPMFSVRAKCTGVIIECRVLATIFLIVLPLPCAVTLLTVCFDLGYSTLPGETNLS